MQTFGDILCVFHSLSSTHALAPPLRLHSPQPDPLRFSIVMDYNMPVDSGDDTTLPFSMMGRSHYGRLYSINPKV